MSFHELEDLVNPFGPVGYSKDEADALAGKIGLSLVPPASIVFLPTVKRVTAQEGLFFKLDRAQVQALDRDCVDRYYFRQASEPNAHLKALYESIFPGDELLDQFVEDWRKQHPV